MVESYTFTRNYIYSGNLFFFFLKSEKWNHLVTIVNKTNRIIKIIVEGLYFLPWGKHFQQNDINSIQFLVCTMCTTETCHHVYLQNLNHEILLPRSMNVERKEAKISKTRFQWEEHTKVKLDWKLWQCFSELYYCAIINLTLQRILLLNIWCHVQWTLECLFLVMIWILYFFMYRWWFKAFLNEISKILKVSQYWVNDFTTVCVSLKLYMFMWYGMMIGMDY